METQMQHPLAKITALAAALALGGCMTAQQWTKNPPLTTVNEDQPLGGDNLVAFGQVSEDHAPLQAGQLILVGEIYWFAIDKAESAELTRVFTSDLPQQFLFTDKSGAKNYQALPVILDEKDRQHFSSEVCLRYDTTDPAEVAKLQALDFKSQKIGHYPAYGRCLAMNGTMFIKPPNLPYDQRFQKSLPIEIKVRHQKRETDMVNIVSNIALLPATLSADTVGSVVMTPAWIKAGMDYFMKDDQETPATKP
jgi:membrane protein (fragment)